MSRIDRVEVHTFEFDVENLGVRCRCGQHDLPGRRPSESQSVRNQNPL
jgi:hypothetical protein